MFKELTLQNIWESVMPVENDSTLKVKSTLWWPTLVEGLSTLNSPLTNLRTRDDLPTAASPKRTSLN